MTYTIRTTDVPDEAARNAIVTPLVAYNEARTGRSDQRPLIIVIEDTEAGMVGGLWGRTAYDWLFVELLVIPPASVSPAAPRPVL